MQKIYSTRISPVKIKLRMSFDKANYEISERVKNLLKSSRITMTADQSFAWVVEGRSKREDKINKQDLLEVIRGDAYLSKYLRTQIADLIDPEVKSKKGAQPLSIKTEGDRIFKVIRIYPRVLKEVKEEKSGIFGGRWRGSKGAAETARERTADEVNRLTGSSISGATVEKILQEHGDIQIINRAIADKPKEQIKPS